MDILQQSLQAADILSGEDNDDLFGELGLTFNNPSSETVGLPTELEALATQGDTLYNADNGTLSQPNFEGFMPANDLSGMLGFDTSQFLNTSASVNVSTTSSNMQGSTEQNVDYRYMPQANYQQKNAQNNLSSTQQQSFRSTSLEQLAAQTNPSGSYTNHYQSVSQTRTPTVPRSSAPVLLQPASNARTTTTIAQSIVVATCNSVFSKAPTQSLTTSVQMQLATQPSSNASQPNVVQTARSMQLSTPIQIVQPSNTVAQQGNRQLVTLVQKPTIIQVGSPANSTQPSAQVVNGVAIQPQQQNHNLAFVKIAGTNRTLNLNDPKIVKALTANLLQKQQIEAQTVTQPQQQVLKLGQNNAVLNVVPQRSQQQAVLPVRGTQQITLQNGQTILLNNGQQVQICKTQSQAGQIQVLQPAATVQTVAAAVRTNHQPTSGTMQAARNGQVPIKGIQIASVNIPIASSSISNTTANIASVQGNLLAIPLVPKQDITQSTVTVNSVYSASVNSGMVSQANTSQTPNSSTVRSLLANAILKQNNTPRTTTQVQTNVVTSNEGVVNGHQPSSAAQSQVGTMLRLNLTPQQLAQLSPMQLQAILKQHQLSLQARTAANADTSTKKQTAATVPAHANAEKSPMHTPQSSVSPVLRTSQQNPAGVTTTVNTSKPPGAEQAMMHVYRVDPTLTEAHVDEVKKLLANRTIASKLDRLTREQQQLVLAFQAQIKTMSHPVQQYYLRNPQLFMQKVLQQVRTGKPFVLQVKVDPQQKPRIVSSTVTTPKPQHPTISLTQEPNRVNNRVNTPSPVMVATVSQQPKPRPATPSTKPTVPLTVKPTVTVQVPKQAIKRPALETPAKVSLVLEQLDCHKRMVANPDCTHPFKSVRDAIRRLVPFHTCNIPNVKEDHFSESEKMFDQISDRIVARTRTMVNKYHLLCLRDSTRDSCSAEMVMIERMFLQKEKAKLAEDKARLQENPSLIREYFPRRTSSEAKSVRSDDGDKSAHQADSQNISILSANDEDKSAESPLSDDDASAFSRISESSSDFRTHPSGRYYSHDSSCGPTSAKRPRHASSDNSLTKEPEAMLLQEAVDSIMM